MRLQDILWGCAKAVLNLGKLVVGWSGLLEGGGFSLRMLGDVDWGGLGVGSTPALAELGRGTRRCGDLDGKTNEVVDGRTRADAGDLKEDANEVFGL
jgi:hypothetical protein